MARTLVVVVLFLPASLVAQKVDSLVMVNNDVITGEIKELTRGKLAYKTADMGTLSVEWDKVRRLKTPHYYEIEVSSGWKYFGSLAWPAEDYRIVVVLTSTDTLEMRDVVSISRIREGFLQRSSGYVDFGFNLTRANNQFDSPKLDLSFDLSVTPSLTDFGRVRTQWDFRTSYELISDFFVGLKGFFTYDNRPPTVDAVKQDYSVNFTIGWSWS